MDRRTDRQTYLLIEMQFYISVMFLGLPDKTFIFQFWLGTDGPTDGRNNCWVDQQMDRPSYRDGFLTDACRNRVFAQA